jgi:hypothetical protein
MGFKCHNCKVFMPLTNQYTRMYFKWKDKSKMVKVHVCKDCWDKARSLKVPEMKR